MAFINTNQGIMYDDSHILGIKTKISMVLKILISRPCLYRL